ncbi:Dead/deah box RNA helicase [Globisporangium polare]
MKISLTSTIAAIVASDSSSAADIAVIGARDAPTMRSTDDATAASTAARGVDVKIAAADILSKPTALLNKNTLAMDNNVFVSRSNIVFSQSDRLISWARLQQHDRYFVVSSPRGQLLSTWYFMNHACSCSLA